MLLYFYVVYFYLTSAPVVHITDNLPVSDTVSWLLLVILLLISVRCALSSVQRCTLKTSLQINLYQLYSVVTSYIS